MARARRNTRWQRGERGQGAIALAVVAVVLAAAVGLLLRTAILASNIDSKIENIAKTGRGINEATDAILQLDTTNNLGKSILATSEPLAPSLDQIVQVAASIEGLATSINGTALDVNSTARGINSTASVIQTTARSINNGVAQINRNVDTTISLAQKVKADTGNIRAETQQVHKQGACIDQALTQARDGHC